MNEFTRTPTRCNIVALRPSPETEARIERDEARRDEALERFNAEERRLTARIGRVLRGVRSTAVGAWHVLTR